MLIVARISSHASNGRFASTKRLDRTTQANITRRTVHGNHIVEQFASMVHSALCRSSLRRCDGPHAIGRSPLVAACA